MDSDLNEKNYDVTLQDVNGITIDGVNYKINGGRKFSLEADNLTVELPTKVAVRPRSNRELTSTTQYKDLLGHHICAGIEAVTIRLSGKMWADDLGHPRESQFAPITMQLLNDIRIYNHQMFLQDYHGVVTNVATPIYSLCNKTDLLGNTLYDSKGLPVVVTKISNIKRGVDSERGMYITYTLELEEDREA